MYQKNTKKVIPDGESLFVSFRWMEDQFLIVDAPNSVTDVFWMMDEVSDPSAIKNIQVCPSDDFSTEAINISELNDRLITIDWQNAILAE